MHEKGGMSIERKGNNDKNYINQERETMTRKKRRGESVSVYIIIKIRRAEEEDGLRD